MAQSKRVPNPLDYVDGKALGKHLRSNPVKGPRPAAATSTNVDAVLRGVRNRKLRKKYPNSNIPKGKI